MWVRNAISNIDDNLQVEKADAVVLSRPAEAINERYV